ncbi:MAG: ComEC/Rec2 family competence protein, partial [Paracoccaceae bacterium]
MSHFVRLRSILDFEGGSISTQRAFVLVAVMLVAVLFDRRAISLRSVALAAAILLLLRPEALFSPGFQMSFAATTALVVAFLWWKDSAFQSRRKVVNWGLGVFLSSFVARIATAPYAAYH